MRRADRLFRLVQLLRARRFATGEQIASELGVSKRTVYRDVADLQGSGVPIKGEAGVGYRLERGYELAPLIFTSDELAGLVLGARIVAAWGDADLAEAVASAMTKVEAVLPEALRRVVLETPLFAPGRPSASAIAGDVALLRRAISERRPVPFKYGREDGTQSERDARPLRLGKEGDACRRVRAARRLPELPSGSHAGAPAPRSELRPRAGRHLAGGLRREGRSRRLGELGVARRCRDCRRRNRRADPALIPANPPVRPRASKHGLPCHAGRWRVCARAADHTTVPPREYRGLRLDSRSMRATRDRRRDTLGRFRGDGSDAADGVRRPSLAARPDRPSRRSPTMNESR